MAKNSGTVYIYENKLVSGNPSAKVDKELTPKKGLDDLVRKSHCVIFQTHSIFPFDLYPNGVTICIDKVIFVYRGFGTRDEFPILIESITGARVTKTLFFSSLSIETFGFKITPEPVKYLRHTDARLARRYILALIECKKANVDLNDYAIEEIQEKLKDIGMVREGEMSPRDIRHHQL
jgi:hypothetical protein